MLIQKERLWEAMVTSGFSFRMEGILQVQQAKIIYVVISDGHCKIGLKHSKELRNGFEFESTKDLNLSVKTISIHCQELVEV